MSFFTYLLASAPYGTLYCGHTDNLIARVSQHRDKVRGGFTARYGVARLVWYEQHGERSGAFRRERQIKKWNRRWKVRLIEAENPAWRDLFQELVGCANPEGPLASLPLVPAATDRPLGSPPSRG